jgi:predicted nucleotidyltransferase
MGGLMTRPSEGTIAEAVLAEVRLLPAAGAFIYGSVATGAAGPHSDIDVFVLLNVQLPHGQQEITRAAFAALQHGLGFHPDPEFPVELFTLAECGTGLSSPRLHATIHRLCLNEQASAAADETDAMEILRALAGRHIPVRQSPALGELVERATELVRNAVAAHPGTEYHRILAALGARI